MDKENQPPSPSQLVTDRNESTRKTGGKDQTVPDVAANEEIAVANIAERIKRNRRPATKMYAQASPTRADAPPSAPRLDTATTLAAFVAAAATAPPPSPSRSRPPPLPGLQHFAPRSPLKRKASATFEEPPHKVKHVAQDFGNGRRLSQKPRAIRQRQERAAEKAAFSKAKPQSMTDRQLLSRLRQSSPSGSSSTLVASPKPKKSNQNTPTDQLSQTANAISIRNKKAAKIAALPSAVSKNTVLSQPEPEQQRSKPRKSVAESQDRQEQSQAEPLTPSAREADVQAIAGSFSVGVEEKRKSMSSATTRVKTGSVTRVQYEDIRTYSKPDEDLDWTKVTDPKISLRMQSRISSRKHIAKKRAAELDDTPEHASSLGESPRSALTPDIKPPTSAKRIRIHPPRAPDNPAARQARRSQVQPVMPVHHLTKADALELTDSEFVEATKAVLEATSRSAGKALTFAVKQARRLQTLLLVATPPEADDAIYLSGEEASKYLEANKYFGGPIFTKNQQTLPTQTVEKFLAECYDDDVTVYVQDPAVRVARNTPHVRARTMADVKQRFAKPPTDKPWNLLELAAHCEDGLRPAFLNTEDCRLLTKLKFPSSGDKASRKGYDPGWKEVEKWALVAQAGALTEPHQDSHGYSTYITVNEGIFGYGWLSNPTTEERQAWSRSHHSYIGGRWCYSVLRPGDTVYFPAGTVHFVFRLPAAGNTLAFGGHVLRCSQIVRWIKTLIEEKAAPDITNEDLTVSAPGYLDRVEKFVQQAMQTGQEEKWGGKEAIEEFLRLKVKFETMKPGK
ncbi:hypothetical protein LTR85_000536 [Meristemomyces frigidus]|nr:hypothetical protein LTR85_000536 [Meristemomyces frigidus]